MTTRYPLADVAALIGQPARAAMLLGLLDQQALTAMALARIANLSPPATSLHLAKLVHGGLVIARRAGRHRYHELASSDVARALEALGVISTAAPHRPRSSLHPAPHPALHPAPHSALRTARTCYDHLAGVLAIDLVERWERARLLRVEADDRYAVTRAGTRWFRDALDIDISSLSGGRRPLARRCLDWTERRPHLAGALGAAILERFLQRRWIARTRDSRALRVTLHGNTAIASLARGKLT